jgi:DNA processing protein
VWRWTFPARNRIIAALASTTIVVEAGGRSGALLTAGFARALGRPIGAVPGPISSPASVGSNALLADGAYVVRGPQDVLDELFGAGVRRAAADPREALSAQHRRLLDAIARGHDTAGALGRAGYPGQAALAALASLELAGYVRRGAGGRWRVVP